MTAAGLGNAGERVEAARRMYDVVRRLYPLCRSITGEGLRESLRILAETVPLERSEVPSGTRVFDWTVPKEWNIREAWIADASGRRVVDFADHNLHVVSYSTPFRGRLGLQELAPHLHDLPDRPSWIPYRTSYYNETWGFCLTHDARRAMGPGPYDVLIDSSLKDGALTIAEHFVAGTSDREFVVSCHCCHPSLANDNLSAMAVCSEMAARLTARRTRYGYRFLFLPGTIGAITWLALNRDRLPRIAGGLVVAGVGDRGGFTYKRSRRGDARIDRVVERVLRRSGEDHRVEPFTPYGYDERQYNSPGIGLEVGRLGRTPYGQYPEYHTSADDLGFVHPESLAGALDLLLRVVDELESDPTYLNLEPRCEPQLGRRGLYRALGGDPDPGASQMAMLWILNFADGDHGLGEIAERSGIPIETLSRTAETLARHGLLRRDD